MLGKFRDRHLKKVLWGLVIIIVPSFVFWGGISYLKGRRHQVLAQLGKTKITATKYKGYLEMARIYSLLFEGGRDRKIKREDLQNKAWEFILLTWKAKKENIKVEDQEVVAVIKRLFFPTSDFNKEWYFNFLQRSLRIGSREFEEYLRRFIMVTKLYEKYMQVDVSDEEVKEFYRRGTQKIKIVYIMRPFEDFKDKVSVTSGEAQEFYRKNLMLFRQDPQVKIKYVVINQEDASRDQIQEALSSVKSLEELGEKFSVEVKTTDFIGPKDPIEGIGWEERVNSAAFSLPLNLVSPPLEIKDGFTIIKKVDEEPAAIPAFDDIAKEAEAKLIQAKLRAAAEAECKALLTKLKESNLDDLRVFAKRERLEYTTTDFFGFSDYIEGLGLDERVSNILFSMGKGQIHDEPISMPKGSYIVQLYDLTPFDEKEFEENRDKYLSTLTNQKTFIARLKLLTQISKEANLKVYPQQ